MSGAGEEIGSEHAISTFIWEPSTQLDSPFSQAAHHELPSFLPIHGRVGTGREVEARSSPDCIPTHGLIGGINKLGYKEKIEMAEGRDSNRQPIG